MKKRLLTIILCLIMIIPSALAGCAKESAEDELNKAELARLTQSFVMYVMTEKETDQDAAQKVEDAINKILKSKFKTRLDIRYITEDEYYEKLEAEIKAMKADQDAEEEAKNNNVSIETETGVETEEETILNKYGLPEYKYPDFANHQVDIFFIGSEEKYNEYIDAKWLRALDSELSAGSKKLDDYISRPFLLAAGLNGSTYAIPNNRVIGEYTYLLLNKELMNKYYYAPSDITSVTDAKNFLIDVKNHEPDFDPIAFDSYKEPTLVHYWSIDPDTLEWDPSKFSMIGCTYNNSFTYAKEKSKDAKPTSNYLPFSSLFTRTTYTNQLLALKYYETNNFYAEENSDKKFAMSVVKGGAELADKYSDEYYVSVIDYPRATSEELYGSMFGICEYSRGADSRLMEIITYLNTNSEFRNLLQYGIENENYIINEEGAVERTKDNKYFMDINKTGNVFIAYPEEGMSLDAWTYGKKQNYDAKIECTIGFSLKEKASEIEEGIDTAAIRAILNESAKIEKELAAITDYDAYAAKLTEYASKYRNNVALKIQGYTTPGREKDGEPRFPISIYYSWLENSGFISNDQ